MSKRDYLREFRRNGVTVTRNLISDGTYTGKVMRWAESWIAMRQTQWLPIWLAITAIFIATASWLFPR